MCSEGPAVPGRTDDRGKPVRVLDPAGAADWPMAGDRRMELLAARLQAASGPTLFPQVVIVTTTMAGVIGFIFAIRVLLPSMPQWGHMLVLVGVCMGWGWVVARAKKKLAAASLSELLIQEGLCPQCGYNFLGLDADGDGTLQCPECGAGWRAERVRRVAAFAPDARMADANTVLAISSASWVGKDDRGSRRNYVHPRLRKEIKAAADDEQRARLREARIEIARNGRILRWLIAIVLLGVAASFGVAMFLYGNPALSSRWVVVIPSGLFGFMGLAVLFGNFGYSKRKIKRAMLGRRLCPSCAASLECAQPEGDGRVVCPDCLAAWDPPPD